MELSTEESKRIKHRVNVKDYTYDDECKSDDECIKHTPNESFLSVYNINDAYIKTEGDCSFSYKYALLVGLGHCLSISHIIPFLTLIPTLLCSEDNGLSWSSCGKTEICAYHLKTPFEDISYKLSNGHMLDNWISDFNLMCTSKITLGLFGSLHFAGNVIGAMFILRLGDIYGRKPVLLFSTLSTMFVVFSMYFTQNLYLVYALLVISGMLIIAKGTMAYIYMLELIPDSRCGIYHTVVCVLGSSFSCLCVILFYYLTDLRIYFLVISALCFLYFLILLRTPESPHFLYTQKRWDELRNVFNKISSVNKSNHHNLKFRMELMNINDESDQAVSLFDALKDSVYLKNIIIMVINWSVCSVSFHLLTFCVGHFSGNIYMNSLVLGIADIFSNGISYIYVKKVGFNYGFSISYFTVLVICLIYTFVPFNQFIKYGILFMIRFLLTLCGSLSYFGSSQYFEANIKSRSFAICKFCSKLLTVFSPIIAELVPSPALFISIVICSAAVGSQFLEKPKTREEKALKDS